MKHLLSWILFLFVLALVLPNVELGWPGTVVLAVVCFLFLPHRST